MTCPLQTFRRDTDWRGVEAMGTKRPTQPLPRKTSTSSVTSADSAATDASEASGVSGAKSEQSQSSSMAGQALASPAALPGEPLSMRPHAASPAITLGSTAAAAAAADEVDEVTPVVSVPPSRPQLRARHPPTPASRSPPLSARNSISADAVAPQHRPTGSAPSARVGTAPPCQPPDGVLDLGDESFDIMDATYDFSLLGMRRLLYGDPEPFIVKVGIRRVSRGHYFQD